MAQDEIAFKSGDRVRAVQDIPHDTLPEIIIASEGDEGTVIRGSFTYFNGTACNVQFDGDESNRSSMFEPINVKYLAHVDQAGDDA